MKKSKFELGASDGKHYWLTPPDLYAKLDSEFHFDCDPCPHPVPPGWHGLVEPWGKRNYVNPPFGGHEFNGVRYGITAWVRKAFKERAQGRLSVIVLPFYKWQSMLITQSSEVRNLGDVRWLAIEDGKSGKGSGRHFLAFVLRP